MHTPYYTADDIVKILGALTAFVIAVVGAIASIIAAWKSHRGNETTKEVAAIIEKKVDDVHACLSEARNEINQRNGGGS